MTGLCPACRVSDLRVTFETTTMFDGRGRTSEPPNEDNFKAAGCGNTACGTILTRDERNCDGLLGAHLSTGVGFGARTELKDDLLRASFIAAIEGVLVASR